MGKKLTDEEEKEVARLVASDNVFIKEICERFGLSRITVHRIAARQGVRRPSGRQPRTLSEEEINQIFELAQTDMSQRAIGEKFGLSQSRISSLLRYHGIYKPHGRPKPKREKSVGWRGGIHKAPQGYVWELVDHDDPMASMRTSNGYVLQHRLVMARHLGRPPHPNRKRPPHQRHPRRQPTRKPRTLDPPPTQRCQGKRDGPLCDLLM